MKHVGKEITRIETSDYHLGTKTISLIECQTCGFAHQYPLPTLEQLGDYYAYHFYQKQKPDYLTKMDEESDYWQTLYTWRINQLKPFLKNVTPNVLDVGSSGGFFLNAARTLGANVYGIEPSEQAANYCKDKFGIEVSVDIYEKCEYQSKFFDVVHISLVLEHLLDPKHFVSWAKNILKEDGILIIEAPFEFNDLQNVLVKEMAYPHWYFSYPDHINYFSKDMLTTFVESQDFKRVEALSSYPMEAFVLGGCDYLKDPEKGGLAHKSRMNFEMNLLKNNSEKVYTNMSRSWSENNIGRTQILYFASK